MRRFPAVLLLAGASCCARDARADGPAPGETLAPVFLIAKSENKNQVQYVVRLDDRCAPVGRTPVSAYWRMLERGPNETAPLLPREMRAYGLASQEVIAGAGAGEVRAVLTAIPSRPLTIATSRGANGACRALATVSIAGTPAHLFTVYVRLKWDGVDSLLLQGWSMDGKRILSETLRR